MIGAFLAGRFRLGVGLERMVQFGTAVQLVGGLAGVALYAAGVVTVAGIVGPVVVFMIGTGLGLPNAPAGALGPFPHMAGSAPALLGFFQMGFSAPVGIAVRHRHGRSPLAILAAIPPVPLGRAPTSWPVGQPPPRPPRGGGTSSGFKP